MNNSNKNDSVIKRYLSDPVFDKFKDDLKELFCEIRKEKINIDADFWNMELREHDTITLYYKSCAFNFKLKVTDSLCTYKLFVSDPLKNRMNKFIQKDFFDNEYNNPINKELVKLSHFFVKYKSNFEQTVNDTSYNHGQKERKRQQYLTALFEEDTDCIVIDNEVAIEKVNEDIGKVTFNKKCLIKSNKENKTFKELDLLLLKRNNDGKYEFVPIEIKMGNNPSYREAVCQVNAYTRAVKKYINDFVYCYQKVVEQKSKLGILDLKLKDLEIQHSISKSLVLVLYDEVVPNGAQKVKILKEILKYCESACKFENQKVDAFEVPFINENDGENKRKVKDYIIGENK